MTQPTRIAFIGRKQGTDHRRAGDFLGGFTLERPRKNEEAGLKASGMIKTDTPAEADLVYVRINPERVNQRALKRVKRAEAKLPKGVKVINSTQAFERYADKTQCFSHWQRAGLQCPNFHTWSPWASLSTLVKAITPLLARYKGLYLRTSNEDSGKGIHYLPADSSKADIQRTIWQIRWRSLTNKVSGSRLMAVEPIDTQDSNGIAHVYRAHVAGNTILGGYALVGQGPVVHSRDLVHQNWDAFVEQNATFQDIIKTPELSAQIILACQALGADVGAVEFFKTASGLCFLELNPMWGGHHRFGDDAFMNYLKQHGDRKELSNAMHWLDATTYYKNLYQALMALTTHRNHKQSA